MNKKTKKILMTAMALIALVGLVISIIMPLSAMLNQ